MKPILALSLLAAAATVTNPAVAQTGAAAAASSLPAGAYTMDKNHAKIVWAADHLGFSTYYGQFTDFDAKLNLDPKAPTKSSLEVTISIASVDTRNDTLDGHLKGDQWLDATKFPTATFKSTQVVLGANNTAKVTGNFTLHGVTKPLTLDVKLHGAGSHPMAKVPAVGFDATGTIKRSDYGVSTFLPMIGDDVKLMISAEFQQAK